MKNSVKLENYLCSLDTESMVYTLIGAAGFFV